jgi:hypothetical protein
MEYKLATSTTVDRSRTVQPHRSAARCAPIRQSVRVPRRLPYTDGSVIAVPLRTGGYALGVVAAHDGHGGVIGYFFDRKYVALPALEYLDRLTPASAVRVMRFGDLGLVRGTWPVLGPLGGWVSDDWPIPAFGRRDLSGRAYRVTYDPSDLADACREEVISDEEVNRLPRDALSGSGAVERVLTELATRS